MRDRPRASPLAPARQPRIERQPTVSAGSAALDLPEVYDSWARERHLETAPRQSSPLCGPAERERPTITEPGAALRYLFDPDSPADSAALRLSARVDPPGEELVWEVDGVPVAKVGYPYTIRQLLPPGRHTIAAHMARRSEVSRPVTVEIAN